MSVKREEREENIADILYREPPPPPKPKRYTSVHHDRVKNERHHVPAATMGPAELKLEEPEHFLRKGRGVQRFREFSPQRRCLSNTRHPRLPKMDPITQRQQENFVRKNIRSAKESKARSPQKYINDSVDGHKFRLEDSDLKYVYKEKFGAVPRYILKRKDEMRRMEEEHRKRMEKKEMPFNVISQEEREKMLEGLKMNWNQAQKKLLCLPLMIDTVNKINKKKKIENTLKELEKSIQMVENNPYIYVYE